METGWQPANEVEREMASALLAGDSGRYAQLLRSAPLYLPMLVEGAEWPEGLPELDDAQVVAFTSPASLYSVLGGLASGHEQQDLTSLRERWPDPDHRLVLNPGLPIGVLLSFAEVDDIAEGRQTLLPVQDVQDAVVDGVLAEVRRMCLEELGGDEEKAGAAVDAESANELETQLTEVVGRLDFDAFLLALISSEVIVLTDRPVPDAGRIADEDFPWRIVGGADSPVIPVFSSSLVLDRVAVGSPPRVQVPFLDVLTNWPSDEHVLCFNPGTATELTLPGGSVPELVAALNDAS